MCRGAGVVANMVQHFNLRSTRSASQISTSHEISSPVSVHHTAGQRPGGAALRHVLSSSSASNLLNQSPGPAPGSGLLASRSVTELNDQTSLHSSMPTAPPPPAPSPPDKRFSGSGNIQCQSCIHFHLCIMTRDVRSSFRHLLLRHHC